MTPEEYHRQLFPEICKKDFDRFKELGLIKEPDYKFAKEYSKEQLLLHNVSQCNELLAFEDWINKNTTTALKDGIKLALENYKKANCG